MILPGDRTVQFQDLLCLEAGVLQRRKIGLLNSDRSCDGTAEAFSSEVGSLHISSKPNACVFYFLFVLNAYQLCGSASNAVHTAVLTVRQTP